MRSYIFYSTLSVLESICLVQSVIMLDTEVHWVAAGFTELSLLVRSGLPKVSTLHSRRSFGGNGVSSLNETTTRLRILFQITVDAHYESLYPIRQRYL